MLDLVEANRYAEIHVRGIIVQGTIVKYRISVGEKPLLKVTPCYFTATIVSVSVFVVGVQNS